MELWLNFLCSSFMLLKRLNTFFLCIFNSIMHSVYLSLFGFNCSFKWPNLRFKLSNDIVKLFNFLIEFSITIIVNFLLLLSFNFKIFKNLSMLSFFLGNFRFKLFVHLFNLLSMSFLFFLKRTLVILVHILNSDFLVFFQIISFLFKLNSVVTF